MAATAVNSSSNCGLWPIDIPSLAESAYRFGNLPRRFAFKPIDIPVDALTLDSNIDSWRALCSSWIDLMNRLAEDLVSDSTLFSLIHGVGASEPFSHILFMIFSCNASAQLCGDPVFGVWNSGRCHRFLVAVKHIAESIQETSTIAVVAGIRIWKEPFKATLLDIEGRHTQSHPPTAAAPAPPPPPPPPWGSSSSGVGDHAERTSSAASSSSVSSSAASSSSVSSSAASRSAAPPSILNPIGPIGFSIDRLIAYCVDDDDIKTALFEAKARVVRSGTSQPQVHQVLSQLSLAQKSRLKPALIKIMTENAALRMGLDPETGGQFITQSFGELIGSWAEKLLN